MRVLACVRARTCVSLSLCSVGLMITCTNYNYCKPPGINDHALSGSVAKTGQHVQRVGSDRILCGKCHSEFPPNTYKELPVSMVH